MATFGFLVQKSHGMEPRDVEQAMQAGRGQGGRGHGDLEQRFGLRPLRRHISRSLSAGGLAITELVSDEPTPGPSASLPPDDAFMVGIQVGRSEHELWFDGRPAPSPVFRPGQTCFYDLRRDPVVLINGPYHSLQVYVPLAQLNAAAAEAGRGRIDDLDYALGQPADDPVLHHLGRAALPAFGDDGPGESLYLDQLLQALATHVAQRYGRVPVVRGPAGLARWQERRAMALMDARLDQGVTLAELAEVCGLSAGHFARAFRASTGLPPHRWMIRRRIERAQALLASGEPLSAVALACGFADQSHFTRVFARAVGQPPGAWRAARGRRLAPE